MRATEITVQVFDDLATITRQLKAAGFQPTRQYTLNDWYFTHLSTSGGVDYPRLMQNSFLVRQVIAAQTQVQLCYKDKTIDADGVVLSEEKIKVELSDLSATLQILTRANLNCWCTLKQNVTVFAKGEQEFAVQAVEGLGNFIEYEETAAMANLSPQQKMALLSAQIKGLNLHLGTDWSCKKVLMQYQNTQKR